MKMNILKPGIIYLLLLISFILVASTTEQQRKRYIAYMGSLPEGEYSPALHHMEIIKHVVDPSFASKALVRSYQRSFNGFAAYLSEQEREKLSGYDGIVSLFPCQKLHLQTTRSWDFMGVSTKIERRPAAESDTIVGVLDSGIWPESESFSDEDFGPIPPKWKGTCNGGSDFICNRKIIGARSYVIDANLSNSARDLNGHGTHVASIAAGNYVNGASFYGLASGVARGGVPSARIAVYKVCLDSCFITEILSAFDDAIADGVDIISISIGTKDPLDLSSDPISIGAFHATVKGILTVNAAGNGGPNLYTVGSYAPWLFTVGASYTDRRIVGKVLLGNDAIIVQGNGINDLPSSDEAVPLVYGNEWSHSCSETEARKCDSECLEGGSLKQKIVLCDDHPSLEDLKSIGALGCIFWPKTREENVSNILQCPAISLSKESLKLVRSFKFSTTDPEVRILRSETIANQAAPRVAPFSSRGPSRFMHDMIKPDVVAPGVEILAAFSPMRSPSESILDRRSVKYSIVSGTSMSCPHVTGAAAYVKTFHPNWSPSTIKSALMTTAMEFTDDLNPEGEFTFGSGHIEPVKALNPGLVYETSIEEYLHIWCNMSRPTNSSCPTTLTPRDINYPSMAAEIDGRFPFMTIFPRRVKNVGIANSTYVADIEGDHSKLDVSVEPKTMQFTALNQQKSFRVIVRGKRVKPYAIKRMSLVLTDGVHKVRSPLVIYTTKKGSGGEKTSPTPSKTYGIFSFMMILLVLY